MPEIAKNLTLDLQDRKLYVDGKEFPWHLAASGPRFDCEPVESGLCLVYLPVLAESIEVIPPREDSTPQEV